MNNLQVIEIEGKRVLTTKQIADEYGVDEKTISYNFNYNKNRYVMGKHYVRLTGIDLKEFLQSGLSRTQNLRSEIIGDKNVSKIRALYLWTEKGALLHAKSINTDKAWEVYDYLVDFYFRVKEQPRQQVKPPEERGRLVMDIPDNRKIQEQIAKVRDYMTAAGVELERYNRYQEEKSYEAVAKNLHDITMDMTIQVFNLLDIKPGTVRKHF